MREDAQRALSLALALMVALSVVLVGSVTGPAHVEEVDQSEVSPVGESEAVVPVGLLAVAVVAGSVTACTNDQVNFGPCGESVNKTELNKTDTQETENEIHTQTANVAQRNEQYQDTLSNYITDSENVARIKGKNAYIRALENGSTKAAAKTKARQAVEDYYARMQMQLITSWETDVATLDKIHQTTTETGGLEDRDVLSFTGWNENGDSGKVSKEFDGVYEASSDTQSVTLVNGTTVTVSELYVEAWVWSGTNDKDICSTNIPFRGEDEPSLSGDPDRRGLMVWDECQPGDYNNGYVHTITQNPPDNSYDSRVIVDFRRTEEQWHTIEDKENTVQNDVTSFVDATYDSYQQGDIDSSDLIDPYLAAREYDPDADFGTWSLRQMTSLGIDPPQELDNVGKMNVTHNGTTYSGILLSDGSPSGGSYEVGQEYDPTQITGKQAVLDMETRQLVLLQVNNFTLESIETPDGESRTTVNYTDISYENTDMSEFEALLDRLANRSARIEARQQALLDDGSSGGGLLGDGGSLFGGDFPPSLPDSIPAPLNMGGYETVAGGGVGIYVFRGLL